MGLGSLIGTVNTVSFSNPQGYIQDVYRSFADADS